MNENQEWVSREISSVFSEQINLKLYTHEVYNMNELQWMCCVSRAIDWVDNAICVFTNGPLNIGWLLHCMMLKSTYLVYFYETFLLYKKASSKSSQMVRRIEKKDLYHCVYCGCKARKKVCEWERLKKGRKKDRATMNI